MNETPEIEALEKMSLGELRELAAERGVMGTGDFTKEELIDQILPKDPATSGQERKPADTGSDAGGARGSCLLRGLGVGIQIVSGFGILLNIALFILIINLARGQIPALEAAMVRTAGDLDDVAASIEAASDALASVDQSLVTTSSLLDTTSDALGNLIPFVDRVALTVGTEVPEVIQSSQQSLTSAQAGARTIDRALRLISLVPLIGVDYSPEQSLDASLGAVVEDLEPLPESMVKLQGDLDTLSGDIADIEIDAREVSTSVLALSQDLEVLRESLDAQSQTISTLASDLSAAAEGVSTLMMIFALIIILSLLGITMGQIAAIYVGGQMGRN